MPLKPTFGIEADCGITVLVLILPFTGLNAPAGGKPELVCFVSDSDAQGWRELTFPGVFRKDVGNFLRQRANARVDSAAVFQIQIFAIFQIFVDKLIKPSERIGVNLVPLAAVEQLINKKERVTVEVIFISLFVKPPVLLGKEYGVFMQLFYRFRRQTCVGPHVCQRVIPFIDPSKEIVGVTIQHFTDVREHFGGRRGLALLPGLDGSKYSAVGCGSVAVPDRAIRRLISISEILLCFVLALAAFFEPLNEYIFIHIYVCTSLKLMKNIDSYLL